jgi:cation transporter-like permease
MRPLAASFLLISILFVSPTVALKHQHSPLHIAIMAKKIKANTESAVLGELKETIRKQAAQIEELNAQLQQKTNYVTRGGGGGHHGNAEVTADELATYLSRPFYSLARQRVGWLSFFLFSLSGTAFIVHGFEKTLARQLELAYFVPLLAGHGGNTGGQTVGTVLSALSSGSVTLKDAPKVILKEAFSGLSVGLILGSIFGPMLHYCMGISMHVSMVIFCTLPLVSTIDATLGSSIPFGCLALGLDASVIAAPAMTSFVDVSGLMSYFLIANQVFKLFGVDL